MRFLIAVLVAVMAAPTLAQGVDEGETRSAAKSVTVELRFVRDEWRGYYDRALGEDWLVGRLTDTFSRAGYTPVWDIPGIRAESEDREYLEGNRWVQSPTKPRPGTIVVGSLIAEVTATMTVGENGGRVRLDNQELDLSRGVARTRLAVVIRERSSGRVVSSYAVTGVANANRRVAASVLNRLFGNRGVDLDSFSEEPEELQVKAMESALKNLGRELTLSSSRSPITTRGIRR